jgi:hypothetical protein
VVMGGSGGVLEHEGEERKVRGHGHLVRRALEAELTERGGGRRQRRLQSWGKQRHSSRWAGLVAKGGGYEGGAP